MAINQLPPPSNFPISPLRVFLVEDSAPVRELILENLEEIPGLIVVGFADTEAGALAALSNDAPDVVIFDIELKQGNGISLLRSLASAGLLHTTLKVIFSNNVSTAYRRVGKQYGVAYFFDKTSELPQLCSLLQRVRQGLLHD